jgi:hypothetical protein
VAWNVFIGHSYRYEQTKRTQKAKTGPAANVAAKQEAASLKPPHSGAAEGSPGNIAL